MALKVAALFSGGKDSTFAVWHCLQKGYEVERLITMEPARKDSYMFHYPNIGWTKMQAGAMGIRHSIHRTSGEKEKEVSDMIAAIKPLRHDVDAIAAGGLASSYQADRIGRVCHGLGLKAVVPFWHIDIEKYWRMILEAGFEVIITGVSADGLGREWLGRRIDEEGLKELKRLSEKHRFHLGGEGGEYESMVLDGPVFRKRLIPVEAEVRWDRETSSGFYIIRDMMAVDKKELGHLMKDYHHKREKIMERLKDFRKLGGTASEGRLFAELAFCLCTPQSKAKSCWAAVEGLQKSGILLKGRSHKEIEANLKGVRFHRNKARYIEEARKTLTKNNRLDVRGFLSAGDGNSARRELLVKNIKGLGYKEASHFLRNIGMGKGIAILDRHILKNLSRLGVIDETPKSLTRKKYLEAERRMSAFCSHAGIPEEELDLLLWSRETGEIFK